MLMLASSSHVYKPFVMNFLIQRERERERERACADREKNPQKTLSELDPVWQRLIFIFIYILLMGGGQRIHITLKADHHQPNREIPFKWCFASGRWYRDIECWLGNMLFFEGSGLEFLKLYFLIFQGGGPDPLPPLGLRINRNYFLTYLREQCRLHAASFSKHSYLTIPELEHPTIPDVRKVIIKANKIAP